MMEQLALLPEAMVMFIVVVGGIPAAVFSLKQGVFRLVVLYALSLVLMFGIYGGMYHGYVSAFMQVAGVTILGAGFFLFAYGGRRNIGRLVEQVERQGEVVCDGR